MKSLFIFSCVVFTVLTVVVQAEQSVVSPNGIIQQPLVPLAPLFPRPQEEREPYQVDMPTEKPTVFSQPLAPVFPGQNVSQTETAGSNEQPVIRGQNRTMDDVAGILDIPPPVAGGAVAADMIEPKLIESTNASDLPDLVFPANPADNPAQPGSAKPGALATDPVGYKVLLFVIAVTSIGLVCMAFVAYDYRQRWMHSQTMQNDRYLGGGTFDMETEDLYRDYLAGTPAH